jgi:hypothetical protein
MLIASLIMLGVDLAVIMLAVAAIVARKRWVPDRGCGRRIGAGSATMALPHDSAESASEPFARSWFVSR